MYQLLKSILKNPADHTRVSLLYGSKSSKDVLLASELEILSHSQPERLKVHHVLETATATTMASDETGRSPLSGSTGRVTADMIKTALGTDTTMSNKGKFMVLVCGPEGMVRHVAGTKAGENEQGKVGGLLAQLGLKEDQVFKF